MKIKQVCDHTGLTARTVRFYSERGLIHPRRYVQNERNYYEYSVEDVRTLMRINALRQAEFSLEEISCMMQNTQEARAVIALHIQKLEAHEKRMAQLLDCMKTLSDQPNMNFETFADAMKKTEQEEGKAL